MDIDITVNLMSLDASWDLILSCWTKSEPGAFDN